MRNTVTPLSTPTFPEPKQPPANPGDEPKRPRPPDQPVEPRRAPNFAPTCEASQEASAVLRANGEFWTIGFEGRESSLRNRKGLHYIAQLLRHPRDEVLALDLINPTWTSTGQMRELLGASAGADNGRPIEDYLRAGHGDPLLDRQAMAAFEVRLRELREERAAAEASTDEAGANRAEDEIRAVRRELRRAFSVGGRIRVLDNCEKARVSVTHNIRLTVERIAAYQPELGRHLDKCIKTGRFCSYRPERDRPITWLLWTRGGRG